MGSESAILLQQGAGLPKISDRRGRPHQPFFFSENYAKWSFVWYKNLDRSFFRFVTMHAFVSLAFSSFYSSLRSCLRSHEWDGGLLRPAVVLCGNRYSAQRHNLHDKLKQINHMRRAPYHKRHQSHAVRCAFSVKLEYRRSWSDRATQQSTLHCFRACCSIIRRAFATTLLWFHNNSSFCCLRYL